jgi:hypothetical protein
MRSSSFHWHKFFMQSVPKEVPRAVRRWAERNIAPEDSNIRKAIEKIGGVNLWKALGFCLSVAREKGPTKREVSRSLLLWICTWRTSRNRIISLRRR